MPSKKQRISYNVSADIYASNVTSGLFLNSPSRSWMQVASLKGDNSNLNSQARRNRQDFNTTAAGAAPVPYAQQSQNELIVLDEDDTEDMTSSNHARSVDTASEAYSERAIGLIPNRKVSAIVCPPDAPSTSQAIPQSFSQLSQADDQHKTAVVLADLAERDTQHASGRPDTATPTRRSASRFVNQESPIRGTPQVSLASPSMRNASMSSVSRHASIDGKSRDDPQRSVNNGSATSRGLDNATITAGETSTLASAQPQTSASLRCTRIHDQFNVHGDTAGDRLLSPPVNRVVTDNLRLTIPHREMLTTNRPVPMNPPRQPQERSVVSAPTSTASQHQAFELHITYLRTQTRFNTLVESRINLIRAALISNDLFFLLLHQLFCLWTLERTWMRRVLLFEYPHALGLHNLQAILSSNTQIPSGILRYFAEFVNSCHLLQHNRSVRLWIEQVKSFLSVFPNGWQALDRLCLQMKVPPPAHLSLYFHRYNSPTLQLICFLDVFNRLFPTASEAFRRDSIRIFESNQKSFLDSGFATISHLQADVMSHPNIESFLNQFEQLKRSHAPSVLFSRSYDSSLKARPAQTHRPTNYNSYPASALLRDSMYEQAMLDTRRHHDLHSISAPTTGAKFSKLQPPDAKAYMKSLDFPNHQNTLSNPSSLMPGDTARHHESDWYSDLLLSASTNQPRPTSRSGAAQIESRQAHPPDAPAPRLAPHEQEYLLTKCYAIFERFHLKPIIMNSKTSHSRSKFDVAPSILNQMVKRTAGKSDRGRYRQQRIILNGAIICRLRCVQLLGDDSTINDSSWHTRPSGWPECCFVSVNGQHVEPPRPRRDDQDSLADITAFIGTENTLEISYFPTPPESLVGFGIAVEMLRCIDHGSALRLPTLLESQSSPNPLVKALHAPIDHEDKAALESQISVDVCDPVTSQLCVRPARGGSCVHRNCFDLEAFLQRAMSSSMDGVACPDIWICPICGRDARPNTLVVDEFLQAVCDQLRRQNNYEVCAILVKQDGSWEPKLSKTMKPAGKYQIVTSEVADDAEQLGTVTEE